MIETASIIMIFLTFLIVASKRLLTYLHVLQQEDYDTGRLFKWIVSNGAFDKRLSFALLVLAFTTSYMPEFFAAFLIFICMALTSFFEKDPRKSPKKKLVATDRAKRIFAVAFVFAAFCSVWCFTVDYPYSLSPWPWIVVLQLLPLLLMSSNLILVPFEQIVQKIYWTEAHNKVKQLNPVVIGVTGSFGKTSVKHILGHILSAQAPTLVTPGSVNTPMGIARIVRERLDENHKFFIVEMGAYGPGSIGRLCDLTPPTMGIITAIGHAHYERFKSLEAVSKTKYELAEAVIRNGTGKVIAHERTLRFPYARQVKMDHPDRFIICGEPPEIDPHKRKDTSYLEKDDIHIYGVMQQSKHLDVKMGIGDKIHNFTPPLYGVHHGHNVVLAVATALELGLDLETIRTALNSMPQIPHRLEVKVMKEEKFTIIDDAYNSNPLGFRSALDLMQIINNGGRKILVTPGMIELGIAHHEIHQQIGQYAGQICDIGIVIMPSRIPSFVDAFKAGGKTLVEVESFAEAQTWINKNKQENDLVLIENDLPDMYERVPKM